MRIRKENLGEIQFKISDFSIRNGELVHSREESSIEKYLAEALREVSRASIFGATWDTWPYAYPEVRDLARRKAIERLQVIEWALNRHGEDAILSTEALCSVTGILCSTKPEELLIARSLLEHNLSALIEGIDLFPKNVDLYRSAILNIEGPCKIGSHGKIWEPLLWEVYKGLVPTVIWHRRK